MTRLLTKKVYATRSLYNPAPSSVHIIDLIHKEEHYPDRTSDEITGQLLLGIKTGVINKTQACYFQVPFTIGVKLRISEYQHDGNAFLGPDGLALRITDHKNREWVFGGTAGVQAGAYNMDDVQTAPNYEQWLRATLYAGRDKDDTDFRRAGLNPPKRAGANGALKKAATPIQHGPGWKGSGQENVFRERMIPKQKISRKTKSRKSVSRKTVSKQKISRKTISRKTIDIKEEDIKEEADIKEEDDIKEGYDIEEGYGIKTEREIKVEPK